MPGYLNWFGLKQILWLCSEAMNFIYHNIVSNVGLSIILYALFVQILFIPFSLKKGFDKAKAEEIKRKREELKAEFMALSEEERANENIKEEYKARDEAIKKEKGSAKVGCLVACLKLFVVLATTPVVRYFDHYISASPEAYNFLGLDLSAGGPGFSLTPAVIIPIITTLVLTIPGIISTQKNLRARKEEQALKTKEELEEEARMLKEMGVKENKIPIGLIVQGLFALLYFYTFSRVALTVSLFWGSYYAIGYLTRGLINIVFTKTNLQLRKEQRKECAD